MSIIKQKFNAEIEKSFFNGRQLCVTHKFVYNS